MQVGRHMRAATEARTVEPRVLSYWSMAPSSARSSVDRHRLEIHPSRAELERAAVAASIVEVVGDPS